jgi:cyclopropane fatty-acyl-phospholipid synthase-like methyltransferase
MKFLDPGHYVGIEPNTWLIEASAQDEKVGDLIRRKRALFLHNDTFDGSAASMAFDYIFSHSVLSHAAHWQLSQFLRNLRRIMNPEAKLLASIRMTNHKGIPQPDSNHSTWQYPGVSFFSFPTVTAAARSTGLTVTWMREYREFYTKYLPDEHHDWLLFKKDPAYVGDIDSANARE